MTMNFHVPVLVFPLSKPLRMTVDEIEVGLLLVIDEGLRTGVPSGYLQSTLLSRQSPHLFLILEYQGGFEPSIPPP